jgi:hypothetical protein
VLGGRFYRWRGEGRRRGQGGGRRARRRPPLRPVARYVAVSGRGRGGDGLGRCRLGAPRTGGKGRRRGEARGRGATAAGAAREVGRRLELEDGPDRWAPPVSGAWEARGIAGRLE